MLEGRLTEEMMGVSKVDGEDKLPELSVVGKKESGTSKEQQSKTQFIPVSKSSLEDRKWADSGMVASIVSGDSMLSLQQWVEDAGFHHIVVTPMGGSSFSLL